ncbi:MAG: efflux RND transporter periplasmic adaptor subunit [Phycisphaeraceae bacterium]|nr:efflux RND transporter periplasmic adaptor subunit [Phycisphaeraceae bacterium]MCW5762360.1 efflux RND transporter periplasmic adaptor subunit [Phycisphaeraceae bacterium]
MPDTAALRCFPPDFKAALAVALLLLGGCTPRPDTPPPAAGQGDADRPTNRVDINASVRQNLGITFASVERRNVASTLRVPGRFELLPTAQREYRSAASGTVELLVEQYQAVEAGTPLYKLDAPRWREMQSELVDAEAAERLAQAAVDSIGPLLDAHHHHHHEIQNIVDLWSARVTTLEQLQASGGALSEEVAQARAAMATARADLAETLETEAELLARRSQSDAQLEAARARLDFLYEAAGTLVGMSASDLRAPSASNASVPRWRTVGAIEVRALAPGVVESVHVVSGGVIDQQARVLSTVEPQRVRFRAVALQSDLPRLADGQRASVVPAQATSVSHPFAGTLRLAPTADPERRTVDLILVSDDGVAAPLWARAGVSAFLEIVLSGTTHKELAIPLRCVARDGTQAIVFRRDPADPDKAIRLEADLGLDDGRWVVIKSGVAEGNEIVLDGVYQLMVATSGSITRGGHFHPDGTFHEGDD